MSSDAQPIALVLPYPPSVNAYWRHVVIKGSARVLISKEGRTYRAVVALTAAHCRPLEGPVKVTATVYRPRRAGDLDNTAKAMLDALKGLAFHDDSQIVELHMRRREDKSNPRAEVLIEPATP